MWRKQQVVAHERPELEEEKNSLVLQVLSIFLPAVWYQQTNHYILNDICLSFPQIANGQKQLKDIEDRILHMLANSQGNILDDEVNSFLYHERPSDAFHSSLDILFCSGPDSNSRCEQNNFKRYKWSVGAGMWGSLSWVVKQDSLSKCCFEWTFVLLAGHRD